MDLTCKRCGNPFSYEWKGGSGRFPWYCQDCKPIVKQETNIAGVRRFKERKRNQTPGLVRRVTRFAMCSEEGCVFFPEQPVVSALDKAVRDKSCVIHHHSARAEEHAALL